MATGSTVLGLSGSVAARSDRTRRSSRDRQSDVQVTDKTGPEEKATVRRAGNDVRNAVGSMWWLLTVDRDRLDELLGKAPTDARLGTYTDALTDLRSTYEVELVEERTDWYEYHLLDSDVEPLARHDRDLHSTAGKLASLIGDGLSAESDDSLEPEYKDTTHERMATRCMQYFDLSYLEMKDLEEGATDPDHTGDKCFNCADDWFNYELDFTFSEGESSNEQLDERERAERNELSADGFPGKGVIEDWLVSVIRSKSGSASPHHMIIEPNTVAVKLTVPAIIGSIVHKFELSGAADSEAQHHMDKAPDVPGTARQVGRALHFLHDASLPLHTGAIFAQAGIDGPPVEFWPAPDPDPKPDIHAAHAAYIKENWYSGANFVDNFDTFPDDHPQDPEAMWEGSAADTVREMGKISGAYSDQIFEHFVEVGTDDPGDTGKHAPIEFETSACLTRAGHYARGMMDQELDGGEFHYI